MDENRRCDPRRHIFKEAPCGHVWCRECHGDVVDGKTSCAHCDDAYDAVDELLDEDAA